jgi:hypothetical protein
MNNRHYSKTPHSIRFDDAIIELSEQYLFQLKMKHRDLSFSALVRIAVTKYIKEKMFDDL